MAEIKEQISLEQRIENTITNHTLSKDTCAGDIKDVLNQHLSDLCTSTKINHFFKGLKIDQKKTTIEDFAQKLFSEYRTLKNYCDITSWLDDDDIEFFHTIFQKLGIESFPYIPNSTEVLKAETEILMEYDLATIFNIYRKRHENIRSLLFVKRKFFPNKKTYQVTLSELHTKMTSANGSIILDLVSENRLFGLNQLFEEAKLPYIDKFEP